MTLQPRLLIGILLFALISVAACNRSDNGADDNADKDVNACRRDEPSADGYTGPPYSDGDERTADTYA